jgi:hypothetical protein
MTHKGEFASSGTSPTPDFRVENHFTIFLLTPLTPAAQFWVQEHLPDEQNRFEFAGSIVVEHRYIADIVRGAIADGLVVKWTINFAWLRDQIRNRIQEHPLEGNHETRNSETDCSQASRRAGRPSRSHF